MDGKYTPGVRPNRDDGPEMVVVGAATRDRVDDDPRGWRLGGGVAYGALTAARLGLRTAALVGVDAEAAGATELGLLADAGIDVRRVDLRRGPVFTNIEVDGGRIQRSDGPSDPIDPAAVPAGWRTAPGWLLAPVAGELPTAWSTVPGESSLVALGWQGLLRALAPGRAVRRVEPLPGPLVERADIVGVGSEDLAPDLELERLTALLRPGATLVLTQGDRGGLVAEVPDRLRRYPALRPDRIVDPVGAGDVFLAALTAARVQPRIVGGRIGQGLDLLLAAAAASIVVEARGLAGVPSRIAVARRMGESVARRQA